MVVHTTLPNRELLSRIAEHDIGLALEQCDCPSRDLTITNKLFQYLLGGLALIATQTQGQAEAIAKAQCGQLVPPDDTATLAEAIAKAQCGQLVPPDDTATLAEAIAKAQCGQLVPPDDTATL
ncbi:hypothetical protein C2W62_20105, partial [Candidatus Entotheonella serta]